MYVGTVRQTEDERDGRRRSERRTEAKDAAAGRSSWERAAEMKIDLHRRSRIDGYCMSRSSLRRDSLEGPTRDLRHDFQAQSVRQRWGEEALEFRKVFLEEVSSEVG